MKRILDEPIPLANVDDWIDDESLYSWCSRYHSISPNDNRSTGLALFGSASAAKCRVVPGNLDHFVEVTGGRLGDSYTILRERTTLGSFSALANPTALSVVASDHQRSASLLGSKFGGLTSLRYCEVCAHQNRAEHGIEIWRIAHQLPGVAVCTLHGKGLRQVQLRRQVWSPPQALPYREFGGNFKEIDILLVAARAASLIHICNRIETDDLRDRAIKVVCNMYAAVDHKRLSAESIEADWRQSTLSQWLVREAPTVSCCGAGWILDLLRDRSSCRNPMKWAYLAAYFHELGVCDADALLFPFKPISEQLDLWDDLGDIPSSVFEVFAHSHSFAEVATRLRVSTTTVRRWAKTKSVLAHLCKEWWRAEKARSSRTGVSSAGGCKGDIG